jgi:hypothetical protein
MFEAEVTDTFGGEANYCWVRRFQAKTARGAIARAARETGYRFRKVADYGDSARYNARGACVCAFVTWIDTEAP